MFLPLTLITTIVGIMGIVVIAIGLPFALGKVPPNKRFGLGTPKTLADEKLWYEANRIAAQGALIAGALLTIAALAVSLLADGASEMTRLLILAAAVLGALAIVASRGFAALDR